MTNSIAVALAVITIAAGGTMSNRATGTFEVKLTPMPGSSETDRPAFPRLALDKTFHGDLAGTSQGEMMSVDATVEGSGGYVAIERITGTLGGRSGSFSVIHNGTMRRGGDFDIAIRIVPDSGTGELEGLTGTMQILIADGKHSYTLDYELPAQERRRS